MSSLIEVGVDMERWLHRRISEFSVVLLPRRQSLGWRNVALVHQPEEVVLPPVVRPDCVAHIRSVAAATRTALVESLPLRGQDEGRCSSLPHLVRGLREES
jgi:hypothetical protein